MNITVTEKEEGVLKAWLKGRRPEAAAFFEDLILEAGTDIRLKDQLDANTVGRVEIKVLADGT